MVCGMMITETKLIIEETITIYCMNLKRHLCVSFSIILPMFDRREIGL